MEVFDLLTQHVSVRDFEATPLSAATKQQLLTAAHAGSSSNFVQATSIIEVQAPALRNELAEISQSAAYVKKKWGLFRLCGGSVPPGPFTGSCGPAGGAGNEFGIVFGQRS